MGYFKPCTSDIQPGQRFGANPNWGPNGPGGHNGNDELAPVGTPVHAAGDGIVLHAGPFDSTYEDNWGWCLNYGGNMVVLNLDGETGPYVEYGHLSEIRVKEGDRVTAGQVIALSGESDGGTGVITGPHLHVGTLPPNFNLNTPTYGRVNPDLYLTDYPDGAGTLTVQSAIITPAAEQPKEWDEMASKEEIFEAVWGGPGTPMIYNNQLDRNEYPRTVLGALQDRIVRQQLIPMRAELAGLVGALAAVNKGEAFDEAKLLAGVQAAAEAGVKNAIDSIETTVTIKEG